jgi:hypothetical protein
MGSSFCYIVFLGSDGPISNLQKGSIILKQDPTTRKDRQPMVKNVFRFSYPSLGKADRPSRPHQLRDGDAFMHVFHILHSFGYSYGGLLLNPTSERPPKITRVTTPVINSTDLILLTTRPPMDDEEEEEKRHIKRSYTDLEVKIFEALQPYFEKCSRGYIELSKSMAEHFSREFMNRARIEFRMNAGASYLRYKEYDDSAHWIPASNPQRTAAYFLFLAEAWPDGPSLITTFGMGGIETLVWSYLLRMRYSHLLRSPRFVMVELLAQAVPRRPLSLDFADGWHTEILLEVSL